MLSFVTDSGGRKHSAFELQQQRPERVAAVGARRRGAGGRGRGRAGAARGGARARRRVPVPRQAGRQDGAGCCGNTARGFVAVFLLLSLYL